MSARKKSARSSMPRPGKSSSYRQRSVHVRTGPQEKAHALHPPIQQSPENRKVEVLRSQQANYYPISRYSPLVSLMLQFGAFCGRPLEFGLRSLTSVRSCLENRAETHGRERSQASRSFRRISKWAAFVHYAGESTRSVVPRPT
jgi:hypothetical protein